jgi:hypothetical protein
MVMVSLTLNEIYSVHGGVVSAADEAEAEKMGEATGEALEKAAAGILLVAGLAAIFA